MAPLASSTPFGCLFLLLMGALRKPAASNPSSVAYLYFPHKRGQALSTGKPLAIVKVKHVP